MWLAPTVVDGVALAAVVWPETLGGSPGWEGCACGFFSLACIRIPGMLALSCCYSCLQPPHDVCLPTSGGSFFECHFFFGDSFYCVLELWGSDPCSLQGRRQEGACWSGLSGPMLWGVSESPGWGGWGQAYMSLQAHGRTW